MNRGSGEIRALFLQTSQAALGFIASEDVAARWESPSALPKFSLRGLVGHLYRATGSVEAYLERPEPAGPPIDAARYYSRAVDVPDIDSDLHRAVRERGEEAAAEGHGSVVARWTELLERLEPRLREESPERRVEVFRGLILSLDDYLVTRIVELVVHIDDVACSVDLDPPQLPEAAFEVAIGCLVDVGRVRHGDRAVVRALARRERDDVQALRVL